MENIVGEGENADNHIVFGKGLHLYQTVTFLTCSLCKILLQTNQVSLIEDNQLVIFDMKNISRGCVVRR